MCGISGILRTRGAAPARVPDERQLHRGPDDHGEYADPYGRAALWFRRLSIIDLSAAGHQPMPNEDRTVWVTFNGEIYNFRALRDDLVRRGHRFRSATDSEVLVHLWEEFGRDMVGRLNGMFAFCIWDQRRGEAFLARDHAGIKPLYIAETEAGLAFASEVKVLLSLSGIDRALDPAALQQYLTFLWVPGERTMWRGVRKLPAGGWLSWSQDRVQQGTWWDWDQSEQEDRPAAEWARAVRTTLLETVDRQLTSDVPLGALVSGGLDSSAIAGAMRELRPAERIRAYTVHLGDGGKDGFVDDLPYARAVGRHLDLDLIEERVKPSIAALLPLLIWHTDEPLADPAIAASFLLCQRAREQGTIVLLSGQGADELYHGYRSHRALRMAGAFSGVPLPLVRAATAVAQGLIGASGTSARALPRRALKMLRFLGASGRERILQLADWGSMAMRREILRPEVIAAGGEPYAEYLELFDRSRARTDEERWSYVLFKTFLPALNLTYGDRTSMAVSVELRVPYLDRALVEQAARIPRGLKIRGREQKWVLGEAAAQWLPPGVRGRSKTGFGAPIREWLTGELGTVVRDMLLGDRFDSRGLFRREGIVTLLHDLETGRRDVAYTIWMLFTFELWARTFLDGDGAAPVPLAA